MFPVQVLQDLGTTKTLEAALHVAVEPFQRLRPQKPVRRATVSTAERLQGLGGNPLQKEVAFVPQETDLAWSLPLAVENSRMRLSPDLQAPYWRLWGPATFHHGCGPTLAFSMMETFGGPSLRDASEVISHQVARDEQGPWLRARST